MTKTKRKRIVQARDGRNLVHVDFSDDAYHQLVESAKENGRTVKGEIEYRVKQTLMEELETQ